MSQEIELALSLGTNAALAGGIAVYAGRHLIANGYVASKSVVKAAKNGVELRVYQYTNTVTAKWMLGCEWCGRAREAVAKWLGDKINRLPHRRIAALSQEVSALKQAAIDGETHNYHVIREVSAGLAERLAALEAGTERADMPTMVQEDLADRIPTLEPVPADEPDPVVEAPVAEPEQPKVGAARIAAKQLRSAIRSGNYDDVYLAVRGGALTVRRDLETTHTLPLVGDATQFEVWVEVADLKGAIGGDDEVALERVSQCRLSVNGRKVACKSADNGFHDVTAISRTQGWAPNRDALARMKDHAGVADIRHFLNGVRVLADDEGGYRMAASDGHRMIVSPQFEDKESHDCLISKQAITNARGKGLLLAAKVGDNARITSVNAAWTKAIVSAQEVGHYPDIDRLIPTDTVPCGTIGKDQLADIKALGDEPYEFNGRTFTAKYIVDAIKALGDCTADMTESGDVLKLTNKEGYTVIVMPHRKPA